MIAISRTSDKFGMHKRQGRYRYMTSMLGLLGMLGTHTAHVYAAYNGLVMPVMLYRSIHDVKDLPFSWSQAELRLILTVDLPYRLHGFYILGTRLYPFQRTPQTGICVLQLFLVELNIVIIVIVLRTATWITQ